LTIYEEMRADGLEEIMSKDDCVDIWELAINDCFSNIRDNHNINYIIGIIEGKLDVKESSIKYVYLIKEQGDDYMLIRQNNKQKDYLKKHGCLNMAYTHEPCVFVLFQRPYADVQLFSTLNGFYLGDNRGRVYQTDWHLDKNNRVCNIIKHVKIVM
jgi:hypothetical protein